MTAYSWRFESPYDKFEYEVTDHLCPECGNSLSRPIPSTMLSCKEGHGPYFLA